MCRNDLEAWEVLGDFVKEGRVGVPGTGEEGRAGRCGAALIDCPEHQANPETAPHAAPTPHNTPATPGPHGSK